jgi:serine/threonine protein kinase
LQRERLGRWFSEEPSPAPKYIVGAADLTLLPSSYLSTKICILDFDQAFLTATPPREVASLPPPYLAPESIFTLTNGPAADVWALGCMLFNLRYPARLFFDWFGSSAKSTATRKRDVLGPLPQEWLTVPFYKGHPVHEPLEPGVEYQTIQPERIVHPDVWSLEQYVDRILEPHRPANSSGKEPRTGIEYFCLRVPRFDHEDIAGKAMFNAENTTPIRKEDAKLFVDLLRKIFEYDHTKRITASQILEHPWMREAGEA